MVEQPVEVVSFFRNSLPLVAEQVTEVPKLAFPDGFLLRSFPLEQQLAERLVEVPFEPAYVGQIVDIPVPHTRRRRPPGGLQGSPQDSVLWNRPLTFQFRQVMDDLFTVFSVARASCGVCCTRAVGDPAASSCGGVFLTSASCILTARACG